jgi:hypothetical protein
MQSIQKSGYYYSNKMARLTIEALESVMGRNGVNAILNLACQPHLIDNYPPDNLDREFDFADFSMLNQALEEMYGPRGGRGLALRAGRAAFDGGLRNFGALAGVGDLAFKMLPLSAKLRIGLPAMAKIFSQTSDQHSTVVERETDFLYRIHRCPVCWERKDMDKPVCFVAAGVILAGLKWVSGGREFRVNESRCISMGDDACEFVIQKDPIA